MTTDLRVGFVGLGSQGAPMAQRIIDHGHPTSLWARRPQSLEPFAGSGVAVADSLVELGRSSDVLCVCVVADQDVDEILRGDRGALTGLRPGGIVLIHSTVRPSTCMQLQTDFPYLEFLDAPVSGGGHKAAEGELLVMVGGENETLERVRPVLETYANPLLHMGPLGAALEAKLLNNAVFTAQLGLASDAFTTAVGRGIDPAAFAAAMAAGSGRSYAGELVGGGDYGLTGFGQFAGPLLAKDLGILEQVLAPHRPGLIDSAHAALVTMGHGMPPIKSLG